MADMDSEIGEKAMLNVLSGCNDGGSYLQKFRLFETRSNFYMTGWDKTRTCWKVLKISRLEESELSIIEDSTTYSLVECDELLKRVHEGNKSSGGLKFVTTCYGIVGFIKFLGPYYMLLITKRQKIGTICGHAVYSIAKSEMIAIPNSTVQSNMSYSKNENRYKKLLRSVDLTKDFFFSYSYHVMLSLQKNLGNHEAGLNLYDTMFVWNEFLTRGIRNQLKNTAWTVPLVHGFFKQDKLSIAEREFNLILIARRSRHYAGTRYLKRGVNEKGRVANDVETEQIVIEDVAEGRPQQISSVVQNRGSIPLFWSQETSRLNIKPEIIISKKDPGFEATKLHFQNLVKRYGNPIIILNLVKTHEKKPRESIIHNEFAQAIKVVNKDLVPKNWLKYLHWDLSRHSRTKGAVPAYLVKVSANILDHTGFFYCQLPSSSSNSRDGNYADGDLANMNKDAHDLTINDGRDVDKSHLAKPPLFQTGVLRTNCIDCLDRTNFAQYAYGLVALGCQLHALGYIDNPMTIYDSPLSHDLMRSYEGMGDTLALQYGGSGAHNKIFSEIRGQWKAATQSQEFFRSLQRYYSNAYMDAEKQDAINVFLGHFLPQQGKPALWQLGSDQDYSVGNRGSVIAEQNASHLSRDNKDQNLLQLKHDTSAIRRSLSDGSILLDTESDTESRINQMDNITEPLPLKIQDCPNVPLQSTPENSPCDSDTSYSRYTPSMPRTQRSPIAQLPKNDGVWAFENDGCQFDFSNFLDADQLSSSGTCEDDTYERSLLSTSPSTGMSSGYGSGWSLEGKEVANEIPPGFSERFLKWVIGDSLFS